MASRGMRSSVRQKLCSTDRERLVGDAVSDEELVSDEEMSSSSGDGSEDNYEEDDDLSRDDDEDDAEDGGDDEDVEDEMEVEGAAGGGIANQETAGKDSDSDRWQNICNVHM